MTRSLGEKLTHTLIVSAVLIAPPLVKESRGEGKASTRSEALKRTATIDCLKIEAPQRPRRSVPKVTDSLAKVGTPIKLNDQSAPEVLTAGVWSPSGDSIAFVAPTGQYMSMNEAEAIKSESDPANAPSVGTARSVNAIWLYSLQDKKWSMVTEDGARPRFSNDGKRLLYMSSHGARAVDLASMAEESLGAPEAGDPHKRFHTEVLSDGTVLSTGSENLLKQWGTTKSSWASIELAPNDEVRIAPNEEHIAVLYNATEGNPNSALVVYDKAGKARSVLKNCPVAAIYSTWSQEGDSLVYPMTANGQPEVWESRLDGGAPSTRVRLQPTQSINELSLSPGNEYVAFSQIEESGRGGVWIANKRGMQRVASGILATWSPKGNRILYAVMRSQGEFDWYVVPVRLKIK
jgi:Tol biopolymer transport system component